MHHHLPSSTPSSRGVKCSQQELKMGFKIWIVTAYQHLQACLWPPLDAQDFAAQAPWSVPVPWRASNHKLKCYFNEPQQQGWNMYLVGLFKVELNGVVTAVKRSMTRSLIRTQFDQELSSFFLCIDCVKQSIIVPMQYPSKYEQQPYLPNSRPIFPKHLRCCRGIQC